MAAIVRVKRRIDDDPANSLLFSCKRLKCDEESKENQPQNDTKETHLFKFAGTVPQKDGAVTTSVRDAIRKSKLQREYKVHGVNLPERSRQQQRASSDCSRYKLVAQRRTLQLDDLNDEEDEEEAQDLNSPSFYGKRECNSDCDGAMGGPVFCLYDIEPEATAIKTPKPQPAAPDKIYCNGLPMVREKVIPGVSIPSANSYVYDIYYLNKPGFDFCALESVLSIEACEHELILPEDDDFYREAYEDDDDSNDEDNWRNDYPDADPMYYDGDGDGGYGGEEELGGRLSYSSDEEWIISNSVQNRLRIGDEDEVDAGLSSDDGGDYTHVQQVSKMDSMYNVQFSGDTDMNDDT